MEILWSIGRFDGGGDILYCSAISRLDPFVRCVMRIFGIRILVFV